MERVSVNDVPHMSSLSRLPYDIRVIIYHHLEADTSLVPRLDCPGLLLSCQQIKKEIEEYARDGLDGLVKKFQKASGCVAALESGHDVPRNITIALPRSSFDAFNGWSTRPRWKRVVLASLNPLFAYPFDKLRVNISGEHCPDATMTRTDLQHQLRFLMRDLWVMIESLNTDAIQPGSSSSGLDQIFKEDSAAELPPFPTAKVQTRRICLSWDCRASPQGQTQVNGRLVTALHPQDRRELPVTETACNEFRTPLDATDPRSFTIYELYAEQCLVGEIGIVSSMRWPLHRFKGSPTIWILDGFDTRRGTIVSSKGLGEDLEHGIAGERNLELEAAEEMRQTAFVNHCMRMARSAGQAIDRWR